MKETKFKIKRGMLHAYNTGELMIGLREKLKLKSKPQSTTRPLEQWTKQALADEDTKFTYIFLIKSF